jgi:hypothetical protein
MFARTTPASSGAAACRATRRGPPVPSTFAYFRRVGQILAELPIHMNPRPEYRFYV